MTRLYLILYSLSATVLAGSALAAVLVAGFYSLPAIVGALAVGAAVALPVAWVLTRHLS